MGNYHLAVAIIIAGIVIVNVFFGSQGVWSHARRCYSTDIIGTVFIGALWQSATSIYRTLLSYRQHGFTTDKYNSLGKPSGGFIEYARFSFF